MFSCQKLQYVFGLGITLLTVGLAQHYDHYDPRPHYGGRHDTYRSYHRGYNYPTFHKPKSIIDPKYYQSILTKFRQCKEQKCSLVKKPYSKDIKESISHIGEYTSCVTACAAAEMLRAVTDFKGLLAAIYDIGAHRLSKVRKYLAGQGEYDVLGECTRIDDSCCLPIDYFTEWERILMPVTVTASTSSGLTLSDTSVRMISVKYYLSYCTEDLGGKDYSEWLRNYNIVCDSNWLQYLEYAQHNVGHLFLEPKCNTLAPDGACNEDLTSNPRSEEFPDDVCVAYECEHGGTKSNVDIPFVKPLAADARHWHESCEDDFVDDDDSDDDDSKLKYRLKYRRVSRQHLKYYTITEGLPSLQTPVDSSSEEATIAALTESNPTLFPTCKYDQGLANKTTEFFEAVDPPSDEALQAVQICPGGGRFEYCNMQQYSSYLQRQLFDNSRCQVCDMTKESDDSPAYYDTLSCLFKITTLKCDCMEAVLNCYEHEFKFKKSLSKTIGKAASILCGFILCQRPKVYSLFGGESAIENSRIMKEILLQVGFSSPHLSSIPPATFAFLSFGLGMVAFTVTKYIVKRVYPSSNISMENGYQNLI